MTAPEATDPVVSPVLPNVDVPMDAPADAPQPDVPAAVVGPRRPSGRAPWRTALEYGGLIIAALVLASLIRAFLGLAFWIPSESMVPTLKVHDRVVVSRLSYRLHDVNRGDIVVFENPGFAGKRKYALPEQLARNVLEVMGIGQPKEKNLIKRVIALPGETIEGRDGAIFINGKKLNEPYLPAGTLPGDGFSPQTIPAASVWVMGDNRNNSCDSRCITDPSNPQTGEMGKAHPFIEVDRIVGRAFVRIWPVNRIGGL